MAPEFCFHSGLPGAPSDGSTLFILRLTPRVDVMTSTLTVGLTPLPAPPDPPSGRPTVCDMMPAGQLTDQKVLLPGPQMAVFAGAWRRFPGILSLLPQG